jgi:hypothetical protein
MYIHTYSTHVHMYVCMFKEGEKIELTEKARAMYIHLTRNLQSFLLRYTIHMYI